MDILIPDMNHFEGENNFGAPLFCQTLPNQAYKK
jgi:hypothetical protein